MSLKYRRIDSNGEPVMGRGLQDFVTNVDAVAQAIITNLKLFKDEWWENLDLGIPMWQDMLGVVGTKLTSIDLLIKDCIENTKDVVRVSNISSTFNSSTRQYTFTCEVDTLYGTTTITNSQGEITR
jgi:hypothetical protein